MSVMFTAEAEKRRQAAVQERNAKRANKRVRATWELLKTPSEVEAVHFARDNGWAEKKVQVKAYRINSKEFEFVVEPFEVDCRCPNLLRYSNYFD